jgi:hypothetical protein
LPAVSRWVKAGVAGEGSEMKEEEARYVLELAPAEGHEGAAEGGEWMGEWVGWVGWWKRGGRDV